LKRFNSGYFGHFGASAQVLILRASLRARCVFLFVGTGMHFPQNRYLFVHTGIIGRTQIPIPRF